MCSLPITGAAIGLSFGIRLLAVAASAQTNPSDSGNDPQRAHALAAAGTCIRIAETGQVTQAKMAGNEADVLLGRHLTRHPRDVDALVALARTVSQCLLPAADLAGQGELSGRAIDLLERALDADATDWTARYVLATILFRSPSFLGRAARAGKELDILLEQQGDRTDNPTFARVFEWRGILHVRAGHADSARSVWTRGAALFPLDTVLSRLASRTGPLEREQLSTTASLAEVRVATSSLPSPAADAMPSVHLITRSQVLMTAGGTADVLQAVQMQPGATLVTEGSGIHTRGGDADETALLLNGGRVLTLSRFEGLHGGMFGTIDPHLVQWLRYSSGGYSVRHGNALSGVLEIETEGRPRERALRAGASLVEMRGTAALPLSRGVGGWIGGRMSNTSALLAIHGRNSEFDGAPHSEEVIGSLVFAPTAMSELRATGLSVRDDSRRVVNAAGWQGAFHSAGEHSALQLSTRWMSSTAPVLLRGNVTRSLRTSDWRFGALARERRDESVATRVDAEWTPSDATTVRAGIEHASRGRDARGTVPTTASAAPGAPTRDAVTGRRAEQGAGAYLEIERVRGSSSVTLGVRGDRLPAEAVITIDPRVAVAMRMGPWTWRLSGGVFHQGRERSTPVIPDAGMPSGIPRTATHLVAGIEREGSLAAMRAEAFVKRYADYVVAGAGPPVIAGRARGIDLAVRRTGGRLTGLLGYSLLGATVRLADGRTVRSPLDVTHTFTATATASVGTDWSLGSTFRYGTGAPITPITGGEERDGRLVPVHGAILSDRLPAYARLDWRLMRFMRRSRFLLTTYAEVLNLAGRRNVASMWYDAEYRRRQPIHAFFARRTVVVGGELQLR